ncbi:MAG: lysylphosphatidylglycerol synthase domain-containing protein [Clostridiales bacterium]|nr:lysylphosphatidylglycerol synthase domain-containing protein [Clostridiales bacterium]
MKALKHHKEKIWLAAKIIFLVLAVFFLARYFILNISDISDIDQYIDWRVFALSILIFIVHKLTLAGLWHYITILGGVRIKPSDAVTAYLYSVLGKYIPGKVFMLLARFPAYKRAGTSLSKVTVCFLLEAVCTILGAVILFIASLFFFPNNLLSGYEPLIAILIAVLFVCMHPKVINFLLRGLERLTKKENLQLSMTYMQMLKVSLLFVLNWLVVGIGYYMLATSVYPVPASELLYTAGIFAISTTIGILAIIAPSGIGVREAIMILGLGLIMPQPYAVMIAVMARLWTTAGEMIVILAAFIVSKVRNK